MAAERSPRSIEILLVEDSPSDVMITHEALREARLLNEITVVEDGAQAMAFLRREGPYASARRPDLILLDLNLPRKSGREVLTEIKSDPDLKIIPVIVLTTSSAEQDVLQAYELHANCYIVKPVEFASFVVAVQSIRQFWLTVVTLPSAVGDG